MKPDDPLEELKLTTARLIERDLTSARRSASDLSYRCSPV